MMYLPSLWHCENLEICWRILWNRNHAVFHASSFTTLRDMTLCRNMQSSSNFTSCFMMVWNNWVKVVGEWHHIATVAGSRIFVCVWKTGFVFGQICGQACKTRVSWHIKFSELITLTVIKQSKYAWSWHLILIGFITQVTEFKYSFAILRYVLLFRCVNALFPHALSHLVRKTLDVHIQNGWKQ